MNKLNVKNKNKKMCINDNSTVRFMNLLVNFEIFMNLLVTFEIFMNLLITSEIFMNLLVTFEIRRKT